MLKINHILSEKKCCYWNSDVFAKLFEDFKINYDKKHVLYNQFLYTLGHGKNYIDKVRILMTHFIYLWNINNNEISDKICNNIWKTYVNNFSVSERSLIVNCIKDVIEANINTSTHQPFEKQKNLVIELQEAQSKIDELTAKFSALLDVYNVQTKTHDEVCKKYSILEEEYHNLSSNYSEVYKIAEFRTQRIDDITELNTRLKNTIDELRSSRDLYKELYNKRIIT